jgi:hypothetical protein
MANNDYQDDELDDNEDVVEAHDPKNAEKQSIGSMKTSANAGPTAKSRKGDKSNGDAMTKVKANMISVAHDLMSEMTEEELEDMIDMVMENGEYEDDLDEALSPEKKKAMKLGAQLASSGLKGNRSGARLQAKDMTGGDSGRQKAASDLLSKNKGTASSFNKGTKAGDKAFGDRSAHVVANFKSKSRMNGPTKKLPEDYEIDYTDLNTLVASEATLSEEFKAKTALIFEAAVKSALSEEIDRLEEAYATELEEELAATKAGLVEKVDSYLNYVVETWMEENKLAVQAGLRTEIAETFMGKLKDLFVESYVDVPESKVDLVDELANANEELEEQLNGAVAKSIKLAEELEGYKRDSIIREAANGLADTQVEKLKTLVEDIDFDDEASFTQKVKTIKEAYFKKKTTESTIVEDTDNDNVEEVSGTMAQYLKAIRKSNI